MKKEGVNKLKIEKYSLLWRGDKNDFNDLTIDYF